MKKTFTLSALFITLLFLTGCSTPIAPGLVRVGVSTGVSLSVIRDPKSEPYLRIAGAIMCQQATGTNLSPAVVRAAIDNSPLANAAKTPQGVLILNGGLGMYTAIWDSYGVNAVNKVPQLKLYLQATCDGFNDALMVAATNQPAVR